MSESEKKQTNMKLTKAERRAIQTMAGQLGLAGGMTEWTSRKIAEEWSKRYPGKEYPDENGEIKPKKGK